MSATRNLWEETFFDDEVPALPCPWCDRGILRPKKGSFCTETPKFLNQDLRDGNIDQFEATHRFSMFLRCVDDKCGNIVAVYGNAVLEERNTAEEYDRYHYRLTPKGMYPAPPLATIPQNTPDSVARELRIAFALFWIDLGSCANRLRISVERILDEFNLPQGTLHTRIQKFQNHDPTHARTFDALRHVGNVGSHDGVVDRVVILDAFEIYQDALAELFGKRRHHIETLTNKIIQNKGR